MVVWACADGNDVVGEVASNGGVAEFTPSSGVTTAMCGRPRASDTKTDDWICIRVTEYEAW